MHFDLRTEDAPDYLAAMVQRPDERLKKNEGKVLPTLIAPKIAFSDVQTTTSCQRSPALR